MTATLIYILKWALSLALLYVPFALLLRKETFTSLNRKALLGIVMLSALLPLAVISIRIEIEQTPTDTTLITENSILQHFIAKSAPSPTLQHSTNNTIQSLFTLKNATYIYLTGVLLSLICYITNIARIITAIRRGTLWCEKINGTTIHCHANETAPFSWFSNIVISETDYNECGEYIVLHEQGHIHHKHSTDMLFLGIVKAFQWFNPFIYMLSADLKEIHEYEADKYVLEHNTDIKSYQMLILKKAVQGYSLPLANSFSQSSVRQRITMMVRKKSNKAMRAKWLYIIPITSLLLAAFAKPEYTFITPTPAPNGTESRKESATTTNIPTKITLEETAPQMPAFKPTGVSLPIAIAPIEEEISTQGRDENITRTDNHYEFIDISTVKDEWMLNCDNIKQCSVRLRFTTDSRGRTNSIKANSCNITLAGKASNTQIDKIKEEATRTAMLHIARRKWNNDTPTGYNAYIIFRHGPALTIETDNTLIAGTTAIR